MTTTAINLPLLVRDWVTEHYPNKCCVTTREYYDLVWDPKKGIEERSIAQLVIFTKQTNAYMIDVRAEEVVIHNNAATASGLIYAPSVNKEGYVTSEFRLYTELLDWRSPSFFHELAKRIGQCHCAITVNSSIASKS